VKVHAEMHCGQISLLETQQTYQKLPEREKKQESFKE
jgi:hypothetical protein